MSKKIDLAIKALKKELVESDDFATVMDHFFDITTDPEFMELGRPKQNPIVTKIIEAVAKAYTGRECMVSYSRFIYIKKYNFYHGPCTVVDKSASIIYFTDISKGMMAIVSGDHSDFYRLTSTLVHGTPDQPVFPVLPKETVTD